MNLARQVNMLKEEHVEEQLREEDLTLMLDEVYETPWTLSVMERGGKHTVLSFDVTAGPLQIFSLLIPINNSYLLLNAAEGRLCKDDLKLGDEIITGILETGAQCPLLHLTVMSEL